MGKLVYGVGVNDADYKVTRYAVVKGKTKQVWMCPIYKIWKNLLGRVTNKALPSYNGATVCPEWLYFSNFRAWVLEQDWADKHLDKDLLIKGNKIYSPFTCLFVSRKVNNFILSREADRGDYLIGVCLHKGTGKFMAQCSENKSRQKYLGLYDTEIEAHKAWLDYKKQLAVDLCKDETDQRLIEALINFF